MCHQCRRTDRSRTRSLHRIGQLKAKLSAKPCGGFSNFHIEIHCLPGFQDAPVAARQCGRFGLKRTRQHFHHRYGRHCKLETPLRMGFKQWRESWAKFRMTSKEVDDGRRIDEQKVVVRKPFQTYLFHSSRSLRRVRTLSFPQSFLPVPLRGNNDR